MFRRLELASCITGSILLTCLFVVLPNAGAGITYAVRAFLRDFWWPKELLVLVFGGVLAGLTGVRIGSWMFAMIGRRAYNQSVRVLTRAGSSAAAGAVGFIVGVILGTVLSFLWSSLIYWHHAERYHGDIDTLGIVVLEALVTAAFALVLGTGLIQSRLKLPSA